MESEGGAIFSVPAAGRGDIELHEGISMPASRWVRLPKPACVRIDTKKE